MKLIYKNNLFYLDCLISDNDLARRAGFSWDREQRAWITAFSHVARKVVRCAAPGTYRMIEAHELWELKNELASRATESNIKVPAPADLEYMPFQLAGIEFMISRPNTLLADQMGLGKTIQIIGLCNLIPDIRRVLIICPAGLKRNWIREWLKWSTRKLTIGLTGASYKTDIIVINYDILTRHHNALHAVTWDLIIMDEAHYLKNISAQRTRQVVGWNKIKPIQAYRKIALTGTPIVNRPIELFTVLKYLAPYGWQDKMKYARRFCAAKMGPWGWDMTGASNLAELQKKLRSTVMIRRLKKEVLKDLPDKVRQVIELDPDAKTRKLLKWETNFWNRSTDLDASRIEDSKYQDYMMSWALQNRTFGAGEIATVRREVAEAKIPLVIKHLQDAVASSGKVVCFAHHKSVVAGIAEAFPGEYRMVVGGMNDKQKQKSVDDFQNRKEIKLFIGNIQAAGVGITLTAASHVVFAEISWVPGEMEQCEDRCHRIGTVESVLIQFLVVGSSIDAAIARTYIGKQGVIDEALDSRLTEDQELIELLK